MTQQTITALFDDRTEAQNAIDELVKSGISRTSIRLMPEDDAGRVTAGQTSYDAAGDEKGFWASLGELFMPEEDRYSYVEAMHRGSIMVSVTADAIHAPLAEEILERRGTVNLADRENSWRKEGWTGYAGGTSTAKTGDEVIPIVEEKLRIGKRQVSGGKIKVRSYVIETPVSEQVNLRTESVHVERRPVDRAAEGNEGFRERTIEAEATSEEAVVSKTARVKEELVIKKGVEQRNETVSDTVRTTKVDIDDSRDQKAPLDSPMGSPNRPR